MPSREIDLIKEIEEFYEIKFAEILSGPQNTSFEINPNSKSSRLSGIDYVKMIEIGDLWEKNETTLDSEMTSDCKYIIICKNHDEFLKLMKSTTKDRREHNIVNESMTNTEFKEYVMSNVEFYFISTGRDIVLTTNNINYLENEHRKLNTKGTFELHTYEIKALDILNYFGEVSNNIFELNVRYPLENKMFINEMKTEIAYFIIYQLKLVKENSYANQIRQLCEELGMEATIDEVYSIFLFKHNGITIAHDGKKIINRTGILITEYSEFSIINGAQTMSSLYIAIKEIKAYFEGDEKFQKKLTEIIEKFFIKVNMIHFDEDTKKYISKITYGLNNQTQVKQYDKFQNLIMEVNKKFLDCDSELKVIKAGATKSKFSMNTMEFIKNCYIVKNKPGYAKNFQSKNTETALNLIMQSMDSNVITDIEKLIIYKKNGESKKQLRELGYDDEFLRFYQYSINYAYSLALQLYEESPEDILMYQYVEKIKEYWSNYNHDGTQDYISAFKNDNFYDYIVSNHLYQTYEVAQQVSVENFDKSEFIKYYNQLAPKLSSKSYKNQVIKKYLLDFKINISGYRTVSFYDEKVKEHFLVGYFKEMIDSINESDSNFNYKEELSKYVEYLNNLKTKPLFILYHNESTEDVKYLVDVELTSLEKIINSIPYEDIEQLIKNIETNFNNQSSEFLKVSEKKSFHIRPHGQTKKDVMRFSGDEYITKQSIWINKTIIEQAHKKTTTSN